MTTSMNAFIFAVTTEGLLFTVLAAAFLAYAIAAVCGHFDGATEFEDAEVTMMRSFWLRDKSGGVQGPFEAEEMRRMVRAGMVKSGKVMLAEGGDEVPLENFPWLLATPQDEVRAMNMADGISGRGRAAVIVDTPDSAGAGKGGLERAGKILTVLGLCLVVVDYLLIGFSGLLGIGLLLAGVVVWVIGACRE